MSVVCRPARAQDLEFADALVVSSINDLTERHGFGPMAVSSPPKFQLFSLKDDAEGLWVAEEGHRILGFAWSWVCGDMRFLAQLFVSPDHQGRSVGNELIKRTLEHAEKSDASNKVLITFSFNTVSQGLYIRHGLFPRFPIYSVSAPREDLIGSLRGPQFDFTPLEEEALTLRRLAQADARVLGVSREKHHRYLINDSGTKGFNLYDGSSWAGYAYMDAGGHIGPLAVMESHAVATAFRTALRLAAEGGSSQASAFLPGASEAALDTAMEHGMRIRFPMLLMSSREFGNSFIRATGPKSRRGQRSGWHVLSYTNFFGGAHAPSNLDCTRCSEFGFKHRRSRHVQSLRPVSPLRRWRVSDANFRPGGDVV